MAKETIRRLSNDVGRILVAGAHLAPADPELEKDHQALLALAKQVGAKAPVIGRLAEGAGKVRSGSGKTVAIELIGLATMAAQVKAAQAGAAAAGSLTPITEVPPVPTTCNGRDLDDLHVALVEKGQGRKQVIERAIEGGYIADLRLVEALIYAMGDQWVGDVVCDHAIPALGRAVVNPIRQRLEIKRGTTVDGRRLRALVAVQKQDALDVLATAVKEGSAPVREAAMDAIADHVAGVAEFEPYALEAVAKDRSNEIKRAAIRALGGYASDASLDALLVALDQAHLTRAAAEALGKSLNPAVVDKLLARLKEAVVTAKAPGKRPRTGAKDSGKEASERAGQLCELLLGALAKHTDPAIARVAMELVEDHGAAAAWAAVGSADRAQLVRLADLLRGDDKELFAAAVAAAVRLPADESFERLSAPFGAKGLLQKLQKLKPDKHRESRIDAVLAYFFANVQAVDQRWRDFFLEVLQKSQGARVVSLLGEAREKRAVKPLLAMLAAEKRPDAMIAIIHALGQIGDKIAIDPILGRIGVDAAQWAIQGAVLAINDPASVDKVRAICARLKDPDSWKNWHVRNLLRTLESRFPGC